MQTIKEITIPKLTVLKLIKCHVLVAEIYNKSPNSISLLLEYDSEKNIYMYKSYIYERDIEMIFEFDSYSFLEITEEN